MKLTILFLLLALSTSAQYHRGDNIITIGHNSPDPMREVKLILVQNDYQITTYDTDLNYIETDFKTVKNVKVRLVLFVSDSTVTFKGFVTNTVAMSTHGGGFGFSSTGSDYRCEYRDSKMNIVSYGFDEMERIASKLWAVYQLGFDVNRE